MNPLSDAALYRSTPIHHTLQLYARCELVGARPLHLAYARPFCRLKAPLGLLLLRYAAQTRTCRGGAPPSCCARPFCRLKAPLGLSLLRFAAQTRTCRGEAPPSCYARPFGRSKAPLGLSLLRSAAQTRTCRGKTPPSCYARPFCRLKAPLGLLLLRFAAQTRTFENAPISAACKKKQGKLWQKERGPDGTSPLDKTKAHSFAVCIGFSIRFVELTIFKQNSNTCQMLC